VRILIIGATGNSGLALTKAALSRGLDVTTYVRSAGKLQALLAQDQPPRLTIRTGTLADHTALTSAMAGQDAVINAAGNATIDLDFVPMVHSVIALAEDALGANGRLWLFGGAAALDVPGFGVRAADLPMIPKVYKQHVNTLARVSTTSLDWSMLCPGPMISSPSGEAMEGLRVSADYWPVEAPKPRGFLRTLRILKAFRQRMPEMIVTYEDAASVILDNLAQDGPFSRKRVGLALPPGQSGTKLGSF
jgi:uncharacterized protein